MLRLIKKVIRKILPAKQYENQIDYWEDRAEKYGKRSVLNLAHSEAEMDEVTKKQIDQIFPYLKESILERDKTVLDFGCGVGRFTAPLAESIDGKSIGADPIQKLIDLAPKSEDTSFIKLTDGKIPLANDSIDVVWICLVFGGIKEEDIFNTCVPEIKRVLKPDGLICMVENTAEAPSGQHWYFRDTDWYAQLFPKFNLTEKGSYEDVGQTISIMIGRGND